MEKVDLCIVGAGPAGLSAAIAFKKLALGSGKDLRVIVLEKASEIGGHTLSGAVLQPTALSNLIPDWKSLDSPVLQEAKLDRMFYLTKKYALPIPHPPQMHNKSNYIVSLSRVVKWLGQYAEDMGVEIYSGFAASQILYNDDGSVIGIKTNDVGLSKTFEKKDTYEPGMEIHAPLTLFAEGARGSLTKSLVKKFNLRENCEEQTYALGIKEVWEVKEEVFREGLVWHSIGWPLDYLTYGGAFMYHYKLDGKFLCSIGHVVALDYKNPNLNPYKEFQKFKTHPQVSKYLKNGTCLQYGARVLNEGGVQSLPKLWFPGGGLIGCAAGFLNVPKIKGTHTAMQSGIFAGEAAFKAVTSSDSPSLEEYEKTLKDSWVYKELHEVRNIRPSFKYGLYAGVVYSGIDTLLLRGRVPWTFKHGHKDHEVLTPISDAKPIEYPKPDGILTFDLLESVSRTGTGHEEDQPVHLHLKNGTGPHLENLKKYGGPEGKFCPAGVYEFVEENGESKFRINASNCIHCKTCDIKDPSQNIEWRVPEGGGGPGYDLM